MKKDVENKWSDSWTHILTFWFFLSFWPYEHWRNKISVWRISTCRYANVSEWIKNYYHYSNLHVSTSLCAKEMRQRKNQKLDVMSSVCFCAFPKLRSRLLNSVVYKQHIYIVKSTQTDMNICSGLFIYIKLNMRSCLCGRLKPFMHKHTTIVHSPHY